VTNRERGCSHQTSNRTFERTSPNCHGIEDLPFSVFRDYPEVKNNIIAEECSGLGQRVNQD
jgi:hypothetical protein